MDEMMRSIRRHHCVFTWALQSRDNPSTLSFIPSLFSFLFFYYYECSCHLNLTCDFDPRPIICIIIHLQYINLTRLCMSLLQISYLFSHRCHRHRHRRLRGVSCTEHISTFDETRGVYEKKVMNFPAITNTGL